MADLKVTLMSENGEDHIYPTTKIDIIEDGGDLFEKTKTIALGDPGQILRVTAGGNNVEWVTPYDASTAVISQSVVPGDTNPVSGEAVYQALGSSHASNEISLDDNDFAPGLYSIDISGASSFLLTLGVSFAQEHFIISAEVPEEGPASAINALVGHAEYAIIDATHEITHEFIVYIYYTYNFDNDPTSNRTFLFSVWLDGTEVYTGVLGHVKVRQLLKYI